MKRFSVLIFAVALSLTPSAHSERSLSSQVIQLNKGELIPLTYTMAGDLVETVQPTEIQLIAKQSLWLRFVGSDVEVSQNGVDFKPFSQFVTGELNVGAEPSSGISVKLNLKAK